MSDFVLFNFVYLDVNNVYNQGIFIVNALKCVTFFTCTRFMPHSAGHFEKIAYQLSSGGFTNYDVD